MQRVVDIAVREWLTDLEPHIYPIIKYKGILEI